MTLSIIYIYTYIFMVTPPPQIYLSHFLMVFTVQNSYFAKAKNDLFFFVFVLKYYTQKHSNTLCFLNVFLYTYMEI